MRGKVRKLLKQGFTVVELIVVVAVITVLMGIAFPLVRAGDQGVARNRTLNRLQRLQNCLAGYQAAFGHYPAVPLHGSRDFYLKANDFGIQLPTRTSDVTWRNVRAALLSQPVTVEFPFDAEDDFDREIESASQADVAWAKAAKKTGEPTAVAVLTKGYRPFASRLVTAQLLKSSWSDVQVFRHGLLSFLLPRAEFMLAGESALYDRSAQWKAENDLGQYYDPQTGKPLTATWQELSDDLRSGTGPLHAAARRSVSQAACARWMPNLEGCVRGGGTFYGIETSDGRSFRDRDRALRDAEEGDLCIHAPGSASSPTTGSQYVLDGMTVLDGWETEFFYYSPAPHRSCRIWSAGPDRKTFPPWVDPEKAQKDPKLAAALEWTRDDLTVTMP